MDELGACTAHEWEQTAAMIMRGSGSYNVDRCRRCREIRLVPMFGEPAERERFGWTGFTIGLVAGAGAMLALIQVGCGS